jgi:hypothetical protein
MGLGLTTIYDTINIKKFASDKPETSSGESDKLTSARNASCATFYRTKQISYSVILIPKLRKQEIRHTYQLIPTKQLQITQHRIIPRPRPRARLGAGF